MNKKQIILLYFLAFCLKLQADPTLLKLLITAKPLTALKPPEKAENPLLTIVPSNTQRHLTHLIHGKPKAITTIIAPTVAVTVVDKDKKKTTLESSHATIDAFFNTLEQAAHKIGKETHQVNVTYSHNGHEQEFSSTDEVPTHLTQDGIQLYFYALRRASRYLGQTVKSPLIEKRAKQLNMLTYLTLNPNP